MRNESLSQAVEIDRRLRELWSLHERFLFVPNSNSFLKKITTSLELLSQLVSELAP